jgi:hypothetical protein
MLGAMDVFTEAVNLAQRYEKGDAFRLHVRSRLALVVPVLAVFLAIGIALGLGLFPMMGTHRWGVLLAMVLVPFVLLGSFALQIYVFFAWLELRALEPMLAHGHAPSRGTWITKLRLGKPPPIPWIAAAVLILIPLLVLAAASLKTALLVLAAAILTPVVYALLDAQQRG